MSIVKTSNAYRGALDHFEPETPLDAGEQRRLRAHLEQLDYTAFAANKAVLAHAPGVLDLGSVQRLAIAAANARAQWARIALEVTESGHMPTRDEITTLEESRAAFEELRAAYEGIRRMIERGYIEYRSNA